jgi:hypothetical protein
LATVAAEEHEPHAELHAEPAPVHAVETEGAAANGLIAMAFHQPSLTLYSSLYVGWLKSS